MSTEKIAAVIACHNRREKTLKCLDSLFRQNRDNKEIEIYLLDDASTDGTAEAVKELYPSVNLINGNGYRYWGGGMHDAMTVASQQESDFILWLNDDVVLDGDALRRLTTTYYEVQQQYEGLNVIVGATRNSDSTRLTYSGFRRKNRWHPARLEKVQLAGNAAIPCDTMNGNCVLVPCKVLRKVGVIDPTFIHQLGDIDYGYRTRKAGGMVWVAPTPVGVCDTNPPGKPWLRPHLNIMKAMTILFSPLGLPMTSWFKFYKTHSPYIGYVLFIYMYAKNITKTIIYYSPFLAKLK